MQTLELEIKPHEGIGTILFGSNTQDIHLLLGKADEEENLNEEDDKALVWHYWDIELSLFFDERNGLLLSCVEISNPDATLWGEKIFEMSEDEILELFKNKGYKEIDTETHDWGEKRVSFDDAQVDFYFEEGELMSINYGIYLDQPKVYIFPN